MLPISILSVLVVLLSLYSFRNLYYDWSPLKRVIKNGFEEKRVKLKDGTILNFVEGPNNGPALLLLHGQTMKWEDYSNILPKLARHYHIYAVDCHGHGKSSHFSYKYNCSSMGLDFVWFIKNIIKKPCVISGHSSGGILAAWIAANHKEDVLGIVLEDPPFFSVTPEEMTNTFVWLDGFKIINDFINQSDADDYVVYYIENSYFWSLFGDLKSLVLKSAKKYRIKYPNKPLKIWYIPYKWIHGTRYLDSYDLEFGMSFYTGEWLSGIDQEDILSNIECPSIYIKARTVYGKDGVLYAANKDNDAEKVNRLIKGNKMVTIKSGHDIHFEHPRDFEKIMIEFLNVIN